MALEDILKKIEEKHHKDVKHIENETKEKCRQIKQEIDKEIKELRKKSEDAISSGAQRLKENMLQDARLKTAKELLKVKSNILEEVFKTALGKLEELPFKDYVSWMQRVIPQIIEPDENEIVLPGKLLKDGGIDKFIKDINKKLNGVGRIKLSKNTKEITGGFILKKPKKETDCSFKSILEEKRNNLKVKISKLLF